MIPKNRVKQQQNDRTLGAQCPRCGSFSRTTRVEKKYFVCQCSEHGAFIKLFAKTNTTDQGV